MYQWSRGQTASVGPDFDRGGLGGFCSGKGTESKDKGGGREPFGPAKLHVSLRLDSGQKHKDKAQCVVAA